MYIWDFLVEKVGEQVEEEKTKEWCVGPEKDGVEKISFLEEIMMFFTSFDQISLEQSSHESWALFPWWVVFVRKASSNQEQHRVFQANEP